MAFSKYQADKLFDGYRFIADDLVLVADNDGTIMDIISRQDAGDDVQSLQGILSPGFINCHCHLELSHMKGLIEQTTGLVHFVQQVMTQRHFPEEEILDAISRAEDQMLANGIMAVGDICNNTLTLSQKSKGRLYYHNFIEASGFNPEIAKDRFDRSVAIFQEYAKNYSIPVESNSIVPHAPYSVADELWDLIVNFPGNHLLTIHNQETEGENELFVSGAGEFNTLYERLKIDTSFFIPSGKSSLQTYLPRLINNQSLILVHNVHASEKDILFAANSGLQLYWCLCLNANKYITGQMPPVDLLVKNDCNIVLGTDSLASNHQLDILAEIKTLRQQFPQIEMETALQWATSNGAQALQMDSLLGSFETGKKPGIILINNDYTAQKLA